jgi:tetratricopeptide (TPR) repeat protein
MDRVLAYGYGADESFAAAAAEDDAFALAHAGAALFSLMRGDAVAARDGAVRARERVAGATRREAQHVEALSAITGGEGARGLALIEEHLREFPRDALLLNQASSLIGFGGRPDREEYRLAFLEALAAAYGDDWWFQSSLSFTYHEVRRFAEARALSERSLAQHPGNAAASHNIAHVIFEAADNDGGVAFLEPWLAGYDPRAPFYCHLAWHLALFELHRGNAARALEIHERDIVPSSNPRLSLMDGAALLWRLVLYEAHERPLDWGPVAAIAAKMARPGFIFGDVHAALAYAGCGDAGALDALRESLRGLHAKGHPTAGTVALPLVEGAAAFAAGDYAGALAQLEPVDADIHRMGGSHAQWELFEETMVVCHLRLGQHDKAAPLLRRRLARRASTRDARWLAQAEAARA